MASKIAYSLINSLIYSSTLSATLYVRDPEYWNQ